MPTSPDNRFIVIQTTPEIRVRAESAQIVVTGASDPARVVVLAASTVAGPQGPAGEDTSVLLSEHINADEPHPVYDDGPDLTILYENAKV